MTALRKILFVEEEPVVAAKAAQVPAAKLYLIITGNAPKAARTAAPEAAGGTLKNIALFLAAPFIGLAYIAGLPFVGLGLLAFMAARAAVKIEAVRTGAMMIAAPFIGLACVVFFPLVGLAILAWMGGRAALGAGAPHMA